MVTNVNVNVLDGHVNHIIHCCPAGQFVTLSSMVQNDFEEWLKPLLGKHFGGKFQLFADRVGVTFSALKRSVRKGSTSIETVLRIALETGESPATVFRVTGKTAIHELITQLYGPSSELRMSKRAKEVALAYDALTNEQAKSFYWESLQGLASQQLAQNGGPLSASTTAASGKGRKRGNRSDRG